MKMRNQLCLLFFIIISIAIEKCFCNGKDLPSDFMKCKRDEHFDKCLVDAVNHAIQILRSGNKEFGIPPLEPLAVKKLVIDAGTAPINLRQTLKNVLVNQMISTSKIQRYR